MRLDDALLYAGVELDLAIARALAAYARQLLTARDPESTPKVERYCTELLTWRETTLADLQVNFTALCTVPGTRH
jgi:hypothetical protein